MSKKRLVNETVKHHKLYEAQKKLTRIKEALPDIMTLATWGAGPNTFVERIRKILED